MIWRSLLWLGVVGCLAPITVAQAAKPEPVRTWMSETYRTLAKVARKHPLSKHEKMWDKVSDCAPERTIELRAKVRSLAWKEGELRVSIGPPLGWFQPTSPSPVFIDYTSSYTLRVSETEAARLRTGTFAIVQAKLKLFPDQTAFTLKNSRTNKLVLKIRIGGKIAVLASDDVKFQLDGVDYPIVYGK